MKRLLTYAVLLTWFTAGSCSGQVTQYNYGRNYASSPVLASRLVLSSDARFLRGEGMQLTEIKFVTTGAITPNAVYIPATIERASVERIKINGQMETTGSWVTGQGADSDNAYGTAGVESDGRFAVIDKCLVRGFQGVCVQLDHQDIDCSNNEVSHGLTGIKVSTSDIDVSNNLVHNHRDYGMQVAADAGSVNSWSNRFLGINNGGTSGGGTATAGSAAIISGIGFRSTGDQFADSYIGVEAGGAFNSYVNTWCYHNVKRDIKCTAFGNKFNGCLVHCMDSSTQYQNKVGVELAGGRALFGNGVIESINYAAIAGLTPEAGPTLCEISANLVTVVNTMFVDGDGHEDTVAIRLTGSPSGTRLLNIAFDGTTPFESASERILDGDPATIRDIRAEFYGNFTDALMVNPGASEAAGMKKFFDLPAGWTGSITITDTVGDLGGAGSTITLTEGNAY